MLRGHIEDTGFGQLFQEMFAALTQAGIKCLVQNLSIFRQAIVPKLFEGAMSKGQAEWQLEIVPIPNLQEVRPGQKHIYFTMWEGTTLRPEFVRKINLARAVIVPCEWNRRVFQVSGVNVPVHLAPLGINPEVFNQIRPFPKKCVFGAAGHFKHSPRRKNLKLVLWAFDEAFRGIDDVELRIKGPPEWEAPVFEDKRISVQNHFMDWWQLAQWYGNLTAFVSGSIGEGWGLMQHQAMASGRPVVAAPFGGLTEFFDESVGYEIDYALAPYVPKDLGGESSEEYGYAADPKVESLVAQMRRIYWDRKEAEELGLKAFERAHEFPWSRTAGNLLRVLSLYHRKEPL